MHKLGIAVVGCGMMAQSVHLPNVVRHPELDLLWCCDVDERTLGSVRERFRPRHATTHAADIAADPRCQIVVLSTTHSIRLPLIELFARAGKHIYVEKPLADTLDEMKKIMAVVADTGIKLQVGHNRRMAPAVREALRVLQKHRENPVSPPWRWDREGPARPPLAGEKSTMVLLRVNDDSWSWKLWAYAYGALINEMTHFADLACCFIDCPPISVTVTGRKEANHVVTIRYADESIATIFATAFGSFGYPKELVEIYHNGAAIIIDHLIELRVAGVVDEPFRRVFPVVNDRNPEIEADGIAGYYLRIQAAQAEALARGDNSILPGNPDKGHYALLDDLVQCVKTGATPVCDCRTAAVPTAIIIRALESVDLGGQPVPITPDDYVI